MARIFSEDRLTIVEKDLYDSLLTESEALEKKSGASDYATDVKMPDILKSINRICMRNRRMKPAYTDCWIIGDADELDTIESYDTGKGNVTVGIASDGQTEYNLMPHEYLLGPEMQRILNEAVNDAKTHFPASDEALNRMTLMSRAKTVISSDPSKIYEICGNDPYKINSMMESMSGTVYRHTMGIGIFDVLLCDPRIEDIYIDAPCDRNRIHVTLNGMNGFNSHMRCRTNLMAERGEVRNLISYLKRESGLSYTESDPVLETDIKEQNARATIVGYPMSPEGDAVAIRKHSMRSWTLTRLIGNGTVDPLTAGLLSFLVNKRSTFLICGARGSGKSSLLSALMFEFPLSQRILAIEDTIELPCDRMRRMGYKVQSILVDDRREQTALKSSEEALRVSLRMGESAIVLGEVRGDEAKTLYHSMRTGKSGSSVLGTIHGDSARSVYERVVHDMGITAEAFMSTDIVVTMGTVKSAGNAGNTRRVTEFVSTSERQGEFIPLMQGRELSEEMFDAPIMRRITDSSFMTRDEMVTEIRIRSQIREFLARTASETDERYFDPEWMRMGDDFALCALAQGSDEGGAIDGFKIWFRRYNGFSQ